MQFVDLHNHLLPGIDDGAENIDASIELIKMATADGTCRMVCTPHIHLGRYDNNHSTISSALELLQQAIRKHQVSIEVRAAAEVRFGMELMQWALNGELPFIGSWQGKNVLLLEFPHGEIPFGAEKLTAWLIARNILPMIAHPERNKGVMSNPSKLRPFLQQGCLTQLTAQSVAGGFGEQPKRIAHELLREDCVTIIASDAHNVKHRPPLISQTYQALLEQVGETKVEALSYSTPFAISEIHFS